MDLCRKHGVPWIELIGGLQAYIANLEKTAVRFHSVAELHPYIRLKWPDIKDDFVVWYDGHEIGRIRLAPDVSQTAWVWSIIPPMSLPARTRGVADNRDGAIKDFGAARDDF